MTPFFSFIYQKPTTGLYKKIALSVILLFVFALALPQITLAAVPTVSSIFPKSVLKDSGDIVLIVKGTDFTADAKVTLGFGGAEMTTRVISPLQLEADIPAVKFKTLGTIPVIVVQAGGQSRPPLYLNVELESHWNVLDMIYAEVKNFTSEFPDKMIDKIVKIFSLTVLWVSKALAQYAGGLFEYVFGTMVKEDAWSITRDCINNSASPPVCVPTFAGAAFLTAWGEVKKWANMLIVLALLGVAIATILRFKEYEAKKLLPGILIAALLINFSVVFVGLIIDGSNIIMKELLGATNGTEGSNLVLNIDTAWNNSVLKMPVETAYQALGYAGLNAIFTVMYIIVSIALIWFSFIFMERYVILAILFILSPLAFVFYVFPLPKAKQLFQDWWQHLIKWCFIGLGGAFFLNLATRVLVTFSNLNGGTGFTVTGEQDFPIMIARFSIVILFMLFGLKLVAKADGFAKIAMAAVAAIVAAIVTGGTSIMGSMGGGALKMAGNTKAGESLKERSAGFRDSISGGYGWAREKIGLDKRGTANKAYQERLSARMKPFESLADAEKDDDIVKERAVNASSGAERAAYAKELAKRKKTHLIKDTAEAQRTMANAEAFGVDTGEYVKGNPELAKFNTEKVTAAKENLSSIEIANYMAANPSLQKDQAEQRLAEKAVKISAIKKMNPANIAELKNIDRDIIEQAGANKINKALEEMNKDQVEQIKSMRASAEARNIALLGLVMPLSQVEKDEIATNDRLIDKIKLLKI